MRNEDSLSLHSAFVQVPLQFHLEKQQKNKELDRKMEFDLENPLAGGGEEHQYSDTISALFFSESDHMPCEDYIHNLKATHFNHTFLRCEAISTILQTCNLDPLVSYLAVNYLDRFISRKGMPPEAKPWFMNLISISCFSLAAKMKKTDFSLTDFQRAEGFIFDSETLQRTELLILGALNWRMRSITPLAFIHFFVSMFKLKDPSLIHALTTRAKEIIFKSQHEINLLGFKPSIITASALLSAAHELFPFQTPCFKNAISSCAYVNNEKLLDCCNVMQGMVMNGWNSESGRMTRSDVVVGGGGGGGSDMMTSGEDYNKRRKICDFCNRNHGFQVSSSSDQQQHAHDQQYCTYTSTTIADQC